MSGCIENSSSIHLSLVGTPPTLLAVLVASPEEGNGLVVLPSGVYVPGFLDLKGGDFPTTPLDGDLVRTTPDTVNNTWTFRYNEQSTATSKWEFVGGSAHYQEHTSGDSISPSQASGVYGVWNNSGADMDIVAPFSGTYDIEWGFRGNPPSGEAVQMGIAIGGGDPTDDNTVQVGSNIGTSAMRKRRVTANAGDTFHPKYRGTGTGTHQFAERWLSVIPVRVGGGRAAGTYHNT